MVLILLGDDLYWLTERKFKIMQMHNYFPKLTKTNKNQVYGHFIDLM